MQATDSEVSTILKFKSGFAKAVREVRKLLDKCDDCPNHRYTKVALTSDDNPDSNIVHYDCTVGRSWFAMCYW